MRFQEAEFKENLALHRKRRQFYEALKDGEKQTQLLAVLQISTI
jgi:hypothetical protein